MSNLRNLRKGLKITQKTLGEEIGHTASSVGHYESGRRVPDVATCYLMADALSRRGEKVTIEDIFPNPTKTSHAT